jgi:O-acetyl-ADP-ribose deacetylase (regulator of RNase III)
MHTFLDGRLIAKTGDITKEQVDAVVNAANSTLLGGGGVDGAIHSAGGHEILEECKKIRQSHYPEGLPAGEAVLTGAGRLPADYVIHTVGPVWHGGEQNEDTVLSDAYRNSLTIAAEHSLQTVAFPALSTGIYHFPRERAAGIAFSAIRSHFEKHKLPEKVFLVFFSQSDLNVFIQTIGRSARDTET